MLNNWKLINFSWGFLRWIFHRREKCHPFFIWRDIRQWLKIFEKSFYMIWMSSIVNQSIGSTKSSSIRRISSIDWSNNQWKSTGDTREILLERSSIDWTIRFSIRSNWSSRSFSFNSSIHWKWRRTFDEEHSSSLLSNSLFHSFLRRNLSSAFQGQKSVVIDEISFMTSSHSFLMDIWSNIAMDRKRNEWNWLKTRQIEKEMNLLQISMNRN